MTTHVLAMHMANELLDVPVAVATLVLAAAAVAVASLRARKALDAEKLPLMGVMGAFVFAAQMINFTLPGMPGTSGHLGGGVLLAVLLRPAAAIVTVASILIVQCLIFQDGGLLALGCNIINMGVIPCILGWWIYRAVAGRRDRVAAWRQYLGAWSACLLAVTAGAALVPVQAALAGRLAIPVGHFLAVMVGVHLIVGAIEGAITFAVIAYLRQVRPAALGLSAAPDAPEAPQRLSRKAVAVSLVVTALLLAGVVSWFASSHPDGLEWSYAEHKYGQADQAVKPPSKAMAAVDEIQDKYSPLPDYSKRPAALGTSAAEGDGQAAGDGWGSLAGVIGTAVTLLLVYGLSVLIRRKTRRASKCTTAT